MKNRLITSIVALLNTSGLFGCASEEKLIDGKLISLKKLYSLSGGKVGLRKNTGNFLQMTDGSVIFFSPNIRTDITRVLAGELPKLTAWVQRYAPEEKSCEISQVTFRKVMNTLSVGSYVVREGELERARLSPEWSKIFDFCRNYRDLNAPESKGITDASVLRINKEQFLVTGGVPIEPPYGPVTKLQMKRALVVDISTGLVARTFSLKANHWRHFSVLLPSNEVLLVGGGSDSATEIIDIANGSTRLLSTRLPIEHSYGFACLLSANTCLLMGGLPKPPVDIKTVTRIDLKDDSYSHAGELLKNRRQSNEMDASVVPCNAVALTNDTILVSGGHSSTGSTYIDELRPDAEIVTVNLSK